MHIYVEGRIQAGPVCARYLHTYTIVPVPARLLTELLSEQSDAARVAAQAELEGSCQDLHIASQHDTCTHMPHFLFMPCWSLVISHHHHGTRLKC